MNIRFKVGDTIQKTQDLFTYPGFVSLAHEDEAILREDYQKIRELERVGLFELESV
jgi:hypothetical protein